MFLTVHRHIPGYEAAHVISKYAKLVGEIDDFFLLLLFYLVIRRLKLSEAAIKKDVLSANIRSLTLNLSSLAEIRKAAAEVNPGSLHAFSLNQMRKTMDLPEGGAIVWWILSVTSLLICRQPRRSAVSSGKRCLRICIEHREMQRSVVCMPH